MPAYGEGWTALDLCVCCRSSHTEHCANSDIHPHQPLHLHKLLLKSGKSVFTENHMWETGRTAGSKYFGCMCGRIGRSGFALERWCPALHTHIPPSGPVSQAHSGHHCLPHHRQCSTPQPRPRGGRWPQVQAGRRAQESQRLLNWSMRQAQVLTLSPLGISLSWTQLELGKVAIPVLFYILSFSLPLPSSNSLFSEFWVT